jgi:serine protease Do
MKVQMLAAWLTGLVAVGAGRSMVDAPIAMAKSMEEQTANQVHSRVNGAVVLVRIGARSHGSGFMVSADGWVVTNAHVIANAPGVVTLVMADGKTELPADVVGFAKGGVDLAVLKVNGGAKVAFC